nr:TRNA (guanine-N(7)-)-methyltransferase [Ipomoea batatas]GMD54614.1 TRNA (guanine-N(7)-)-methyltransferase [Ipomoea batatas]
MNSSISLRAPQSQFLSGTRLMQAEQCLSSSRVVFIPTSQQRAKPLKFRSLAVKASVDGGRSNGAASFVGGFVLGGIIAGALGCIYAPQISKVLAGAEIPDKKDLMRKLPKFIYDEEKALEPGPLDGTVTKLSNSVFRNFEPIWEEDTENIVGKDRTAETAIDSMSSQLNTKDAPNGIAVNPDELEASI